MLNGFPKTINAQIDEYQPTEVALWEIKDKNNQTILSGAKVLSYLFQTYYNYKTMLPMYDLWQVYKSIHENDFLKAFEAMSSVYNPIENYNSKEKNISMTNDGMTTVTHGKTLTNTATNVQNETESTSFDSTTYRPTERTIQNGTTTNTESGTTTTDKGVKTLTVDGDDYTADIVNAELKEKSGNIGVTTSQQMIESEIELRKNPVVMLYLNEFANTYFYYVGGDFINDCNF